MCVYACVTLCVNVCVRACACHGVVQVMKKTCCGRNSCLSGGIRQLISFGGKGRIEGWDEAAEGGRLSSSG